MFNKNVIKLGDDEEYIKKAVDTVVVFYIKWGYDYKNNILAYFKVSLN